MEMKNSSSLPCCFVLLQRPCGHEKPVNAGCFELFEGNARAATTHANTFGALLLLECGRDLLCGTCCWCCCSPVSWLTMRDDRVQLTIPMVPMVHWQTRGTIGMCHGRLIPVDVY
jgi:hypothetical protein